MDRRTASALAGALVIATVIVGAVSPAYAEDERARADDVVDVLQDVVDVSPVGGDSVRMTPDGVQASVDGLQIAVPEDPDRGIVVGVGASAVTIGLPFAAEADSAVDTRVPGVAVYDNNNSSVTVPVIRNDGSVQISTVIENSSAPHEYSYVVSMPGDLTLVKGASGDVFATPEGSSIPAVYIAPPWAKDANGNPVATHYEVAGATLTQVVDFTEETAFPVVADPATYIDTTTSSVINVSRQGVVPRWQYLNGCTAAKGRTCSVSRTYTVTASTQTSLGVSKSIISGSIGVTDGQSTAVAATCGVPNGPGTATLYAQAEKTLYQVKTVRRWGVPTAGGGSMHTETKVSGWLAAYKPNGRFSCV